jgi:hypothetical protein
VKVFTREATPRLVATIPTGALPHGIWPSDDQTRVFVGPENGDGVAAVPRRPAIRLERERDLVAERLIAVPVLRDREISKHLTRAQRGGEFVVVERGDPDDDRTQVLRCRIVDDDVADRTGPMKTLASCGGERGFALDLELHPRAATTSASTAIMFVMPSREGWSRLQVQPVQPPFVQSVQSAAI